MDHGYNKHCTETPWSDLYHYKENTGGQIVACGVQDSPTRAELRISKKSYPTLNFELPRQKHELANVQHMLELAYERGRLFQRQEISRVLKATIGI
jgi:hypothetical protein